MCGDVGNVIYIENMYFLEFSLLGSRSLWEYVGRSSCIDGSLCKNACISHENWWAKHSKT